MRTRYAVISLILLSLFITAPAVGQHVQEDLEDYNRLNAQTHTAAQRNIPLNPGTAELAAPWASSKTSASAALVWLLTEQLSQVWDPEASAGAGAWLDESRVTITRNDAGFTTDQLIEEWDVDANAWVNSLRISYIRNEENEPTESVYEAWDETANGGAGGWIPELRFTDTYNEQGNTLVSTTEFWDDDGGEYILFYRTTYTYNDSGELVVERLFESALFGTLEPSILRKFTHDDDGNVIEELVQSYDIATSSWVNLDLVLSTYDGNGELIEEVEQQWDPAANGGAGAWVNAFRSTTVFSPNSVNPTEITETDQFWDPDANSGEGAWINEERSVTTYSATEIIDLEQVWDPLADGGTGAWVNESRSVTTYTVEGDPIESIYQVWDPNAAGGEGDWVNETRGTIELDDNGQISVYLEEAWENGGWVNANRLIMSYENFENVATENEAPAQRFELGANYPNPFNRSTTISYTLAAPEHVRIEVYDMLGRRVSTLVDALTPAGTHSVSFERGELAAGLYVYRLSGESIQKSRAMLLLK